MKKEPAMKKSIAILLLLASLLCLLASCKDASTPHTQSPETLPPRDEAPTDNLPAKDMNHFELCFMVNGSENFSWTDLSLIPDDYNGEDINDTMFERNSYLEERFNCDLSAFEPTSGTITEQDVQNLAMSGDTTTGPQIIMYYDKWVMKSAEYFYDWKNVPYVSIDEQYWDPNVSDLFDIRGKQLALSGSFSLSMLSRTQILLFNKGKYESYFGDISSIYGFVESDEWTLDKLYEIGQDVVENPDNIWDDTDQFGISSSIKELYTGLMVSCGIKFMQKDEDGIPTFTLSSDPYAIEKMQKILKLNVDTDVHFDNGPDIHHAGPEFAFQEERSLFALSSLFGIPLMRATMEAEFGIIPLPKYNSDQKEFNCITYGGVMACLIKTVKEDNLENIGIIMEALAFDSQQNLIPIYKEKLLKTRFASDESSRSMLDIIFTSTMCELGVNFFEDQITLPLIHQIFQPKKDVISSTVSSMSGSVNKEIAKMVQKIK